MPRNLLSINDLTRQEILDIFKQADKFRLRPSSTVTSHTKMSGLLFFEESTRTRIGFESAAWRLGVQSFVMQETKHTSKMSQGESIADTIRTLNAYATLFCVRHPSKDIFKEILPHSKHPVINCGNGYDEHPTQALIDAYTMWEHFGRLDDLILTLIGQTKYSRAVHSLVLLLAKFSNITINELTPSELSLPDIYKNEFLASKNIYQHQSDHKWGREDVIYSTGFPPKNPSGDYTSQVTKQFRVTKKIANELKQDAIILNPLPRIDEIDQAVDDTKQAHYFTQNELGLYVRMAILESYA